MSITVQRQEDGTEPSLPSCAAPILGGRAKRALALAKRLSLPRDEAKLLVLIGSYADAGEQSPPMTQLRRRMGYPRHPGTYPQLDWHLQQLARRKLICIAWAKKTGARRNRYEIRF
jgi:hypothetical protein